MRISTEAGKWKGLFAAALVAAVVLSLPAQAVATPVISMHTELEWQEAFQTGLIQPVEASEFQRMILEEPAWPEEYDNAIFATPVLQVTGDYDGEAGLVMRWDANGIAPGQRVAAAWDYVYPQDPNLGGTTLDFSIFPPVASTLFSLNLIDQHGNYREWIWHAGGAGEPIPGQWTTVTINPATGASNYPTFGGSPFIHDVPGQPFDLASIQIIRFNENISSFFPGQQWPQGPAGVPDGWLWNAWNHVDVAVPEPMTMLAVGLGIASLGGYVRKRRKA